MGNANLRRTFELFITEIQAGLRAYAVSLLGNRESADDACQESLMMMYARLSDGAQIESWKGYLWTVLRRHAVELCRRDGRRLYEYAQSLPQTYEDTNPDARDEFNRAYALMLALPAERREVIELKLLQGMTYQEISMVTNAPLQTVASRYQSGMDELREKWNQHE